MIIARDITHDREIAARLLSAERFAAKGMVAAEITHEINNSLANIETALFIVNNIRTESQYKQEIFKDVHDEIDRMSGIVKGILEVYRSDDAAIESVNLNTEIPKVINMTKRRLSGKVITIISKLTPELPSVPCYPGHIKQILLNLIKNAEESMDVSPQKIITISTSGDNGSVNMHISDTGSGIPPDIRDKVFSHLFTSKPEGYGFGLSICKQIAKKYRGDINLESEEGKGTTVTVSFPVGHHV
jgi:signal transduction histidine kinase